MIVRNQVEALYSMGPQWLELFLEDLGRLAKCDYQIMALLETYAYVSKGYIRARPR